MIALQKRVVLRALFIVEAVLFCSFYYYGSSGMREIHQLQRENEHIEEAIVFVQRDIKECDRELTMRYNDPFYKEKIAREQLHMARDGEEIYLTM